ncbi:unnamed protein product [Fusarium graminearum]|nr:unnamed protein product [Fusarium graminearum]
MNFGHNPKVDNLKKQIPTYYVAPNFTTQPPPDGPLGLGTLVENLKDYYPINQGSANRVAIPTDQLYTDVKENVTASFTKTHSGEGRIFARFLDSSVHGDASLKGKRMDEDIYNMARLETIYFCPQSAYIKKCLKLQDVMDYNEMVGYKHPMYLVTGLKIAWGATILTKHGHGMEGKAESEVLAPAGPIDLQLGATAGASSESGLQSSFGKPADFILGLQVQKLYYKRAFFVGAPTLTTERVTKNAVLVDDDGPNSGYEDDGEFDYILADLDKGDLESLVALTSDDFDGHEV